MITNIICSLSRKLPMKCTFQPSRNFQVTIIGAATTVGSNVAMHLKKNSKVTRLKLHDFDSKVLGIAKNLSVISGGPGVCGFAGGGELEGAVMTSQLVLLVHNAKSKSKMGAAQQARDNAPFVRAVCAALASCNPTAILGISTDPVNIMVPYACEILSLYNCLDSNKVIGITNAGASIARSVAAKSLGVDARFLTIPVIGGHSPDSIVPLFSRLEPRFYILTDDNMSKLTSLVRQALPATPQARENASLKIAWAINEFTENILAALGGENRELHCYTKNPNFGTIFFSGPTVIGSVGVVKPPNYLTMSQAEMNMLIDAVRCINDDVDRAETLSKEEIPLFCN